MEMIKNYFINFKNEQKRVNYRGCNMVKLKKFLFCFVFLSSVVFSKPLVEGYLMGQLGNQLFIIAAAYSLALDHDAAAIFPDLERSQEFNIPLNREKLFPHINANYSRRINFIYSEPCFEYVPIPFHPNMRIKGYFQSEKYFFHHKCEIVKLFAPSLEIQEYLSTKYDWIINHPNAISVHLRSYYREDPTGHIHPTYTRQYFEKAMGLFPEDALFVVFSNDMPWCKEQLHGISRAMTFIEGEAHFHDFYLMSMCKNNIICNSSFSWWAAYLNQNSDKKIIAPSVWFNPKSMLNTKDLIPNEWIVIN